MGGTVDTHLEDVERRAREDVTSHCHPSIWEEREIETGLR